jgi:hypothetical protein
MCCSLGHSSIVLVPHELKLQDGVYHIEGIVDRSPRTLKERVLRYFHNLELLEKIAEVGDESFHLFGSVLKNYTAPGVYHIFRDLHQAAHTFEHVAHAFCFFGDLVRLLFAFLDKGKAPQGAETVKECRGHSHEHGHKSTRIEQLRSAARLSHMISHGLTTAEFLTEHQLCSFGSAQRVFKYAPLFSALGYGLWTISLIYQKSHPKNKLSDRLIHGSGFIFEASSITEEIKRLAPYAGWISPLKAAAGIVHAWHVAQRLMPQDQEKIVGSFSLET